MARTVRTRFLSYRCFRLSLLLILAVVGACPAMARVEPPYLELQLKVGKGRLAIDTGRSKLVPGDQPWRYREPVEDVQKQLLDDVQAALEKSPTLLSIVNGVEKPDPVDLQARKASPTCLSELSWADAKVCFYTSVANPPVTLRNYLHNRLLLDLILNKNRLREWLQETPLAVPDGFTTPNERIDGRIRLPVLPPITRQGIEACGRGNEEAAEATCVINFDETSAKAFAGRITARQLAARLAPLQGRLWNYQKVKRQLGDELRLIGMPLKSAFALTDDTDLVAPRLQPRDGTINVIAPGRLSQIQIGLIKANVGTAEGRPPNRIPELLKILYLLLDQEDFDAVRSAANADLITASRFESETEDPRKTYLVPFAPSAEEGPIGGHFVTSRKLEPRIAELKAIGYQLVTLARDMSDEATLGESDRPYVVRMVIIPSEGWSATEPWKETETPEVITPEASGAEAPSTDTPAAPPATGPGSPLDMKLEEKKNLILIGGGVQSDSPAEFFVEYRRKDLLGNDEVGIRIGRHGKNEISGSYKKDFVAFGGLGRRLSVNITGKSDYDPNPPTDTQADSERRSGGSLSASYALLHGRNSQFLDLSLGYEYEDVDLDPMASPPPAGAAAPDDDHVQRLTIGLSYQKLGSDRLNRPDILIEPSLAVAKSRSERKHYWIAGISGTIHAQLANFFEYDVRARFHRASRRTPLTELPRFGGEESVRGLRTDIAAGRTVWSLQSEAWVPLRGLTERAGATVDNLLRNDLKLALFADVGGVSRNAADVPRTSASIGLGLRYTLQRQATFRLDYAHLLSRAARRFGRDGVYLSFTLSQFNY